MVILGHNLGNSQVSVYRTIGPTLVNSFFNEIHVNKQNSPRCGAAFCDVTPRAILQVCPIKWTLGVIWVKSRELLVAFKVDGKCSLMFYVTVKMLSNVELTENALLNTF